MDESPNFHLLDQLPTQNEIMQSNNNVQTPTNNNLPPIYDNNIPQEVINNNNNNDQIPINYVPPPLYDDNIPKEVMKDNNEGRQTSFDPPPIYDNNIPQEFSKPSENTSAEYPSLSQQEPKTIYQQLNIQNPLGQNNNNYSPQNNMNSDNLNIYDKPIYLPPNIPTPQTVEIEHIPEEPKLEVKEPAYQEPVYQLHELPQPKISENQKSSCCEDCCDECGICCDHCCRDCERCCSQINWAEIICICCVAICYAIISGSSK
jgi:hypothetical protein